MILQYNVSHKMKGEIAMKQPIKTNKKKKKDKLK